MSNLRELPFDTAEVVQVIADSAEMVLTLKITSGPNIGEIIQTKVQIRALPPLNRKIRCSDCKRPEGEQHQPGCHRQGVVTSESDYRDRGGERV